MGSSPSNSAVSTAPSSTDTSSNVSSTASSSPASTSSVSSVISSSTSSTSSTSSLPTSSSSTSSSSTTSSILSSSTTSTSSSATSTAPTTSAGATTIVVTSTSTPFTSSTAETSASSTSSSSTSSAAGTHTAAASSGSKGLSAGGTIAVAVVVPVASVAIIIAVLLWWWRRRKATKLAEEERRKEVEEYGFNPNTDSTLAGGAAGGAAMSQSYGSQDGSAGYRGWGTTSHPRKPSTNLSSIPLSETSAMQFNNEGPMRPESGDAAAIGAAAAVGAHNGDIRRGASNASSAYSAGVHSDGSDDAHMAGSAPNQYYDEGNPYYHDVHNPQAPYGDAGYSMGAPVIRDVQARRNTRIENPGVYPQQGNAGIAQNF